ncbi:MAG: hypothetical protein LLF78_01355 [Synergistaceae bacterium]|nr:hypothetical protein [Synergistaceae bacterium]
MLRLIFVAEVLEIITVEGEYGYVQDWEEDRTGGGILDQISASGRPDLYAWVRDRVILFEQILKDYSGDSLRAKERAADIGRVVQEVGGRDNQEERGEKGSIGEGVSVKKIIVALLLAFCVASMASAANFVEIYRDDDYYSIYLDSDSFQNKGDYVTCWKKCIPIGEELKRVNKISKKKVSHFMYFDAYKLNERQSQNLAQYVYFENGEHEELFNSNLSIDKWKEIVPETVGEHIWEWVKAISEAKYQK